jgi:cell wall-associated NlpC family hydrolase
MQLGRTAVRACALLAGGTLALALGTSLAGPAAANPAGPHDPIGAVSAVRAATGGFTFTGWAADPDALTSNAGVFVIVDGRTRAGAGTTSIANSTVQAKYHTGPTPSFALTVPVDAQPHILCLVAGNVGKGLSTVLKCVPTPLGSALTSAQVAARNPVGKIQLIAGSSTTFELKGWASDPDYLGRRATVVLYVDGGAAATVVTNTYPAPLPANAGALSAFDITVPVSKGMHLGCIWVVNIGLGSGNKFLGCKARDTRGGAGTGTLATPKLNTQVVTEAKKHIGQAYVWGAAGPTTFDCSGLVTYSYKKFGYLTPRTSEAQALAARLIPASRAVPGDLVFMHDSEGDVYHVGIYLSPGLTVAAIDESQGVDYQKIWDPSSVTYGSFTHT